jgi:hypothetical protein
MARGRWLKPEFCTSEQLTLCSLPARLLFALMWCFCDDAGRHAVSVRRLKMEVFPSDSFTEAQMVAWIEELKNAKDRNGVGLLTEYEVGNEVIWEVTGWGRNQKVDKPYFRFPDRDGKVPHSWNGRRTFDERSRQERNGNETNSIGNKKEPYVDVDERTETERAVSWEDVYRDWFVPAARAVSREDPPRPSKSMRETLMKAAYLAAARYGREWLLDGCKVTRTEAKTNPPNFLKGVLAKKTGVEISDLFDKIVVPGEYLKKPEQKAGVS